MSRTLLAGTTNHSTTVRIIDSTDGTPETGVTSATAGLAFNYRRTASAAVAITALNDLALLTTAHTDGGILHIGDGYYRVDFQDAAFAASATDVLLTGTATGMVVIGELYELVAYDPQDAVRLGLTALPNAAADAAGGLPISDAGGLDADAMAADAARLTAARAATMTDWINGGRLDLLLDAIPTTAMRGTDSAATAANLATVDGNVDTLITNVPDVLSLVNINAEVDTALRTTTDGEPAQGAPGATISIEEKISWLYKAWRNRTTATATQYNLYNDDTTTIDTKATLADDGTTASRTEMVTGP